MCRVTYTTDKETIEAMERFIEAMAYQGKRFTKSSLTNLAVIRLLAEYNELPAGKQDEPIAALFKKGR
jgi:hypothetical protein